MSKKYLDSPIYQFLSKTSKGDLGIELEVEGDFSFETVGEDFKKTWKIHQEGSLRGGVEFVLRQPVPMKQMDDALILLGSALDKMPVKSTIRCSTHVHINILPLTPREIYNVISYYYLVEDILVATQGPLRIGNLFCLRMSDADAVAEDLLNSVESQHFFSCFHPNEHKYGALNISAINKFGSLEFRFLRPLTDMKVMAMWCNLFKQLVDNAKNLSIKESLSLVQNESPAGVLSKVFDHNIVEYLLKVVPTGLMQEGILVNYSHIHQLAKAFEKLDYVRIPRHLIDTDMYTSPFMDGGATDEAVELSWISMSDDDQPEEDELW